MIPVLWAGATLVPVLSSIVSTNALIFELVSRGGSSSQHKLIIYAPIQPSHAKRSTHHRLAQNYAKRAAPVLPDTWSALGCYTQVTQSIRS